MTARALTVVQMLAALDGGAIERGTLELARYLCRRGHRSIVISEDGRVLAELESEGSRHTLLKVGAMRPAGLKTVFPLRRLLRRERADILHLSSRLPARIGYLAWKSLPKKDRPHLVTTFHGFYCANRHSAVMTRGERVIAISKSVADHIRTRYRVPAERIVLIHRGVDESYFDPAAVAPQRIEALRKRFELTGSTGPVIMLPGGITPLKGHDIFFKALAIIRNAPWTALCVGSAAEDSRYSLHLRQLIKDLGLTARIRMAGHCDDMPAALMLADVVVSASSGKADAFGRVVVEAMAMGKPVIATAHGGSLEAVLDRQTGWLVPSDNELSLAAALSEAILDKDKRLRFGRAGRKRVRENFTVEKMCRSTLKLYHSLLAHKA